MRRKELAYKNLALGVEFDKYLVEHPEIVDRIPNRSTVVLLPEVAGDPADSSATRSRRISF